MNLEALYNQYKHDLLLYANRRVHDWQLSEEIVDDVFISLWRRDPDVRDYRRYLYQAVKLKCYDGLRKRTNRRVDYIDYFPVMETEVEPYNEDAAYKALCAICTLTPCVLRDMYNFYIKGMSGPWIAAKTGRGAQSVRNNIYRATKLLKENI